MNDEQRHNELERRLDAALDALNAGREPHLDDLADEELEELLDMARLARVLREPEWPEDGFAGVLADGLATELSRPSSNGAVTELEHIPPRELHVVRPHRRRATLLALIAALLRTLGSAVVAGALAGVIAGGVGGRIAMRVSGALYAREHPGESAVTQSSNTPVGEISLSGTIDLLMEGLGTGALAAVLYVIVRRWLPGSPRWHGLAFGVIGLLIAGVSSIDSDNSDFQRIGNPLLNVAMFVAIFVLYGVLLVPLLERLERFSRRAWHGFSLSRVLALGVLLAGVLALLQVAAVLLAFTVTAPILIFEVISGDATLSYLLVAVILIALVALLWLTALTAPALHASTSALPRRAAALVSQRQDTMVRLGQAIFAACVAGGALLLVIEVVRILAG
jgi:hypothetical protein